MRPHPRLNTRDEIPRFANYEDGGINLEGLNTKEIRIDKDLFNSFRVVKVLAEERLVNIPTKVRLFSN